MMPDHFTTRLSTYQLQLSKVNESMTQANMDTAQLKTILKRINCRCLARLKPSSTSIPAYLHCPLVVMLRIAGDTVPYLN